LSTPLPSASKHHQSSWLVIVLLFLVLALPPISIIAAIMVPGPLPEARTVIVPHGSNVYGIASLLDKNEAIRSKTAFRIAAKLLASYQLKAGEYQITPHQSIADIVVMMHEGDSVVHWFTVAEGLTSADITNLLKNDPALTGDIPVPPEGSLLPETYRYSYGDSRAALIARMQKSMQDALNDLWDKRDPSIPLKTPLEAVTLASIVEKETGKVAERPRIAGVFYNRLHQSMRLQSDPTVIYAIVHAKGSLDHELAHDDLMFPSPYNTYASDGLPPLPICNPGRAALDAAMHPEQNDFLYFVADGTGGHVFSKNLAEHNQNVTKWNAIKVKQ